MNRGTTIFVGAGEWRVATVADGRATVAAAAGAAAALEARVQEAKRILEGAGFAGEPVVLALASSQCLCAAISTDGIGRSGRGQAMAFRLEEHLPISAEDMVADYVRTAPGEALGVCGSLVELRELVKAFESAGVRVQHICPAALLAAASAAEEMPSADGVWSARRSPDGNGLSADGCDLIDLRGGKPVRWSWFAQDEADAKARLHEMAAGQAVVRLAVLDSAAPTEGEPSQIECRLLTNQSADEAAALQAAKVLAGTAAPWIDLRRDALAGARKSGLRRGPWGALAAAAALLLVCVSAAAYWRGRSYDAMAQRFTNQQAEAFRSALPGQPVPGNIRRRLSSEWQRAAASLTPEGGASAEGLGPALTHLTELLRSLRTLPPDVRYRVVDLSIQPDLIRVDGQARNILEADRVAAAVRESGLYEVDLPRKQMLKEGEVTFLFAAKPKTPSAAREGPP